MLRRLEDMKARYPFVGDVRGRGLFLSIEMVRDRRTKEPVASAVMQELYRAGIRRGLLAMTYTPHIRLQPALTVSEGAALEGLGILEELFADLEQRGTWR